MGIMTKYKALSRRSALLQPRQIKRLLLICGCLVVGLVIFQYSRIKELQRLQRVQKTLANHLRYELGLVSTDDESADVWRAIDVPESCIFSAYLDTRPEVVRQLNGINENVPWAVRIVAILPLNTKPDSLDCIYRYENGGGRENVRRSPAGRVRPIAENWDLKYSAFFVLCAIEVPGNVIREGFDTHGRFLPSKVSLGRKDDAGKSPNETSFVNIRYPKSGSLRDGRKQELLAVCVPVFHHQYDRPLHLIEFIEYYRMLGAGHFTFYESSASSNVRNVLRRYSDRGNVTVLRWKLHPRYVSEMTLRIEGIFAALNDCLYRSSFHENYKYVAGVDVDEFIVPRKHADFAELLEYLDPENPDGARNKHTAFLFRNAFFYTMYDDDTLHKVRGAPYLYTQAKTKRVLEPNPGKLRSKYIVRSEDVVELGNHQVWEFRTGVSLFSNFRHFTVDIDDALSHHYRYCETDMHVCYRKPTIIDRTAHKYIKELRERVSKSCKEIFGRKGCPAPRD
ncbi:hypothetical protein KM043_002838 [Ampulex compressa]|nr:hypothetical protein KM043_002838 [Ampulex compressa]